MSHQFRAAVATALLMLFGATDCDNGPNSPEDPGQRRPVGCERAGTITDDLLTAFGAPHVKSVVNPCMKFADFLGDITDLVPDNEEKKLVKFLGKANAIIAGISAAQDAIKCAYKQDRFAIGIYQNRQHQWSLGMVAVVGLDLDAAIKGTACFLGEQIPFRGSELDPALGFGAPADARLTFTLPDQRADPEEAVCFGTRERIRAGITFTLLWLGSSDIMCKSLDLQLNPGKTTGFGATATVKAKPQVNVRESPSTGAAAVSQLDRGEVVIVTCHTEGEQVSGRRGESRIWDRVWLHDIEGYVSDVWLDTDGDVTGTTPRC